MSCVADRGSHMEGRKKFNIEVKALDVDHAKKLMIYACVYELKIHISTNHLSWHENIHIAEWMNKTCNKQIYEQFKRYIH